MKTSLIHTHPTQAGRERAQTISPCTASLILFLVVATASCTQMPSKEATDARIKNWMLLDTGGDALANKIVLTEIREGRFSNAIEALEFSIDSSVVILGEAIDSRDHNKDHILKTLRVLKDYRQKHPRETNLAIPDYGSGEKTAIVEKAQEILDEVK